MACSKCGKCCRYFEFTLPQKTLDADLVRYFSFHNVKAGHNEAGEVVLRLNVACKHLTKNNLCRIFERRPDVCRNTKGRAGTIHPEGCTDV